MCCKSTKLDIQALIERLGDHGSMHQNLVGGLLPLELQGRWPVFFTVIPGYEGQQRDRNRDWKPTFERM